jgi:hypothetical protein
MHAESDCLVFERNDPVDVRFVGALVQAIAQEGVRSNLGTDVHSRAAVVEVAYQKSRLKAGLPPKYRNIPTSLSIIHRARREHALDMSPVIIRADELPLCVTALENAAHSTRRLDPALTPDLAASMASHLRSILKNNFEPTNNKPTETQGFVAEENFVPFTNKLEEIY